MTKDVWYVILSFIHIISLGVCIGWIIKLHTDKKRLTTKNQDLVDKVAFKEEKLEEFLVSARKQTEELNILRDANEKLHRQLSIANDRSIDHTIINVKNIYPVKINASCRYYKEDLYSLKLDIKDPMIKKQLLQCMEKDLLKVIKIKELPPDPYGWIMIEGYIEVIPKYDK